MLDDRRKQVRRSLNLRVCLVTGKEPRLHAGTVLDMSESGAMLEVADAEGLPDRFTMLFSRRSVLKRECDLMWRTPTQVGVRFAKRSGLSH